MLFSDQIVVPSKELLAISWAHTIGIVVLCVWKRSNIFLVFSTVEEMGEITLLKFGETKRLRKGCQFHRDEAERVDQFNVHFWNSKGKNFCTTSNDLWSDAIFVQVLQDEISVIGLEIVSDKRSVCVFIFKDPLAKFVFGAPARKHEFLAAFVLCHTKVWNVFSMVLGTLEIEENKVFLLMVLNIILNSNIIVEEIGMTLFFFRRSFPRLHWLEVTLVIFWSYKHLARGTSHLTTIMIVNAGPSDDSLTFPTFH